MNIDEQFPSKYLKSSDLQGEAVKVKIKDVFEETLNGDKKAILYFVNKSKGMVLNKTNAYAIRAVYGPETEDWIGRVIEVVSMPVEYQGRMVDGLRVRVPKQAKATSGFVDETENPAPREPQTAGGDLDDEIPFAPEWRG